ncbi:kelch repeat-containing protein [uncultured Marivirga sp.]|uniref:Kelch repeat-containing protein n=1 Tax=uncultured Marivirga sp. TaxID=1123707 RepID=UPI0030ED6BE9
MKKLLIILLILFSIKVYSQTPNFKWVGGDTTVNPSGSLQKTYVGPRQFAASWQDEDGNYYIFGGEGYSSEGKYGILNDFWQYDQDNGVWKYLSGNIAVNSIAENDNALRFDGKDDYVQVDGLIPYRSDFTWEVTFRKGVDNNAYQGLISLDNFSCCYPDGVSTNFGLFLVNNALYFERPGFVQHFVSNNIETNEWNNISMSVEINENGANELIKFYINGDFINSLEDDFDALIDDTDTTLMATMIGRQRFSYFKGSIDDVVIWNYAKTESEVINELNTAVLPNDSRLTAYFDFNQGIANGDNTETIILDTEIKYFSREDSVDNSLVENQWRLSPDVKITRENDYPLFNYATTPVFNSFDQPFKTEWATGTTAEAEPESYDTFYEIYLNMYYSPEGFVDNPISLFLPEENRYFDVEFSQYTEDPSTTGGPGGGGFAVSYTEVLETIAFDTLADKSINDFDGKLVNFTNRDAPYFKGEIAQLRVWNVARTEQELVNNLLDVDPESAGLMAYFDFNDGIPEGDNSGISHVLDNTSNNFDGNIIGFDLDGINSNFNQSTLPAAAESTGVLKFDGLKDNIEIPNLAVFKDNYTIETWFKTAEDGTLFSWAPPGAESFWLEGGITFFIQSGGLAVDVFNVGGPYGVRKNGNDITDNQWHHVAFTIEKDISGINERIRIYIDGVLENESFYNFSDIINDGSGNFISKIGFTNFNFPFLDFSSGGLIPNSTSNWVPGKDGKAQISKSQSFYISDNDGNLWMFGGKGLDEFASEVMTADLRKYNFETSTWDFISGIEDDNASGIYGNLNEANVNNRPGARLATNGWITNDSIFIFGGEGYDKNGELGFLGDLWLYDIGDNIWTWLAGADTVNSLGNHGGKGVSNENFIPESRKLFSTFQDGEGNFWLFGGQTSSENSNRNDLWKYNPQNSEWTWVSGGDQGDEAGVYTALGEADPSNQPGARSGAQVWYQDDKLWVFGGLGVDVNGQVLDRLNDFWSFDFNSNFWTWEGGPNFAGNTGNYGELGIPSSENIPGARDNGNTFVDHEGQLIMFGGYKFTQGRAGTYNDLWSYNIETKEWTWLDGINQTAGLRVTSSIGELGAGTKLFPKARNGGHTWVDNDGNFWLYGGSPNANSGLGMLNDMWKYDSNNDFWTYYGGSVDADSTKGVYGTKGLGAVTNKPRSRWHGNSWYANDGKLWFFGGISAAGDGGDIVWLNDLWSYDPIGEIYTWESGSSQANEQGKYGSKGIPNINNSPGARSSATSWVDEQGNFWLFGGYESFEYYNDLWKFNPTAKTWTWISGRNSQNIPGSYGVQGEENNQNEIGSRRYTGSWVDDEGNFWVFGGQGRDKASQLGLLNDLWKYNPETKNWIWMKGSNSVNATGHYGTLGVPNPDNNPPARYGYTHWKDNVGNLWLFGGVAVSEWFNDLWRYDVRTNEWTWFGGSKATFDELVLLAPHYNFSNYGTKGIVDPTNVIGNRERAMGFKNDNNAFWLFGGRTNTVLGYNDLWQITFVPGKPYLYPLDTIQSNSFSISFDEAWASSYQVQLSFEEDFSDIISEFNITDRSISIGDLDPATKYYYRIKAINANGESDFTDQNQVLTLPAKPSFKPITKGQLNQRDAVLVWDLLAGEIDEYILQISTDSTFTDEADLISGYASKSIDSDINSTLIEGLSSGTNYYGRIKANNSSGSSRYSDVVSFLTKPSAPDLNETTIRNSITQSSFQLIWNPGTGVFDKYILYLAEDMQFENLVTSFNGVDISKDVNTFIINDLVPGSEYFVTLLSENSSGVSETSDTLMILTRPEAPIFNTTNYLSGVTQNDAILNWEVIPEIFDGYELQLSLDFSFSNENLFLAGYGKDEISRTIDKSQSTDTVRNLEAGTTYFARVRAFNSSGGSNYSNVVAIETIPKAPSFNIINNITQNSASVSWSNPSGAESYLIDVNTSPEYLTDSAIFENFPVAVAFQILEDLEPGTTYYTRLQSTNENGSSGLITPFDYSDTSFVTIPANPFLETALEIQQNTALISWENVKGANRYLLDVSNNGFQTYINNYQGIAVDDNEFLIEELSPGLQYQVRLKSQNGSGNSAYSNVYVFRTIPAQPIARDASTVAATSFTANWDPSVGADYYILEVTDDDFFTYTEQIIDLAIPSRVSNLVEGNSYKYRVKAGNSSGVSPPSNAVEVIVSTNSQTLALSNFDFQEDFRSGEESVPIDIQLGGGQGQISCLIRYKGILDNNWQDSVLLTTIGNQQYRFTVQEFMLDELGFEFELFITDGITSILRSRNLISRSFSNEQSSIIPLLNISSRWQMFSIPYILDDNLIETIFSSLGQLEYETEWRLVHYDGTNYVDAGAGINRIELGKGYWLNFKSQEETQIKVGSGKVNIASPFNMVLREGWNQIGNPYNVTLNWDVVRSANQVFNSVARTLTYDPQDNGFEEDILINAFEGAFVWSDIDTELVINLRGSSSFRVAGNEENYFSGNIDQARWKCPINIEFANGLKNIANIGMSEEALLGKDHLDKMQVPRFVEFTEMYTRHEDYFYPYFQQDIRPSANIERWLFNLSSNQLKGTVKLSWDNEAFKNSVKQLWIIDEENGVLVNMNEINSISLDIKDNHQISIHLTENKNELPLPFKMLMGNPYPNPTNRMNNVNILLPEAMENYEILLSLYSADGSKLATLAEGVYEAGIYNFQLDFEDFENVSSGMLIYKLAVSGPNGQTIFRKVILNK